MLTKISKINKLKKPISTISKKNKIDKTNQISSSKSSPSAILTKGSGSLKLSDKSASIAIKKRVSVQASKNGKKGLESKKKKNIKPDKEVLTKRERRSLKIDAKKHSETVRYLLSKWELLRRDDTEKERKYELINQMLKNSDKALADLCFAHDTSRILESMIQYGNERQQYEMFNLLKPKLMEMSESHFGRFVVKKLISYCAKDQIAELIKMISGSVAKLLAHKYSCEIVELLFNDHANSKQRCEMIQELYGNRDFLGISSNNFGNLSDALELNKTKRTAVLSNLNSILVKLISKNLVNMSMIQRLLLEYLTCEIPSLQCMLPTSGSKSVHMYSNLDIPERIQTLLDAFVEHSQIVPMLHTREGVRVALCILWLSNPKTKKGILKSLKTAVSSIAMNEHGYLFIIGILDFVDDIVLLEKTIIKELLEDLEILVTHPYGRKVLLYALNPRDVLHFTNQLICSVLAPGDASPFTKKPLGLRAFELRSLSVGLLPALLRLAHDKLMTLFIGDRVEHFKPVLDRGRLVLLAEIIIQSSPIALKFEYCSNKYKRTPDITSENPKVTDPTSTELQAIQSLRSNVLEAFINLVISPEFVPSGKQLPKVSDKEFTQLKRRKRSLAIAEEENIRRRKIVVPAFTNMEKKSLRLDEADSECENHENEKMDYEEASDNTKTNFELSQEEELLLEMPWLERPEATPILNRLILNCKCSGSYDLLDLIIKLVPPVVMRSWTTCNRTSFFLVRLLETDYKPICEFIRDKVCNKKMLSALKESSLPGAQVLLKKLP